MMQDPVDNGAGSSGNPIPDGQPLSPEAPLAELIAEGATNVQLVEASQGQDVPPGPDSGKGPKDKPKKEKKPGLVSKIGKIFQYRLALVGPAPKENLTAGKDGDLADPAQEGKAAPAPSKAKKPKKPKVPKEKKTKAPKEKKVKASGAKKDAKAKPKKGAEPGDSAKKGSKKKLLILIVAGVVVLGGGVTVFLLLRSGPTAQEMLDTARQYAQEEKYDKALESYDKVVQTGELMTEAYIGMADALVTAGDMEGAIGKTRLGLEALPGDERLLAKLEELSPSEAQTQAAPRYSTEPIVWKDPAFERMLRLALNRPGGSISENDLKEVKNLKILGGTHASAADGNFPSRNGVDSYAVGGVTYTERGEIATLDDVVHFKNLSSLLVGYNRVSDIDALAGLPLSTIGLYANELEDISALASVPTLRYLYAYNNRISDLSPLKNLTGLTSLSLQHNRIRDISPLSGLSELRELLISNNLLEDISPVRGMKNLGFLNAAENNISDIGPIAELADLTDVSFAGNPVSDYSPASHVQNVNQSFGLTR